MLWELITTAWMRQKAHIASFVGKMRNIQNNVKWTLYGAIWSAFTLLNFILLLEGPNAQQKGNFKMAEIFIAYRKKINGFS